jgi:NADH-quinone oxidoreductase subunit A
MCLGAGLRGKTGFVDDYLPILVLLVLGLLFASLSFVASSLLAPRKKPTAAKTAPYECGIVPSIEPPTRFPVRFYLIAMIFIIFDIEIVFLYPWAVIFRQLRSFGLVEVVVFAGVVFVALLFMVSNGALSWGPAKRLTGGVPPRTSESTIARIAAATAPPAEDGTEDDGSSGEQVPSGPGRAA